MTNADRLDALEAQVALLTGAVRLADPVAAAKLVALPDPEEAATELAAPAEPTEPEPDAAA
jgi:hypothetical protein